MTQTTFDTQQVEPTSSSQTFSHVPTGLHQYAEPASTMTFALMMRQMVLKLVAAAKAKSSNASHENYALNVLQAFIVISLLPLQVSAGDMASQMEQDSAFQGSMSQFQSFFTYIESISKNGPMGNNLPSGWNTSAVGLSKLNNLYSQFYNMFYEGASSSPTWSQMYFEIRDPSSPTGYVKVPFINPQTGELQPDLQKILAAFNSYFSTAADTQPPIMPNPGQINPSSHVPGVLMLLFTSMQTKFNNTFVPMTAGGNYDFASAYGLCTPGGAITGSAFGLLDSSVGAANLFFLKLEQVTPEWVAATPTYLHIPFGLFLYNAANEKMNDPSSTTNRTMFEDVIMPALAYEFVQDSLSPTSDGSLLDSLDNTAGTAQAEADKEGQDQVTTLQTLGQTLATEVQTGQSIASNEASSEAEMVADQTAP